MKFTEAQERINAKVGERILNFDLKEDRIVLSILLTGNGSGRPLTQFAIPSEKYQGLDSDEDFWSCYDEKEILETLKRHEVKIPALPLSNPHFVCGYNDPCGDLMAYWYLDEVIEEVNPSDVGNNFWFSVDMDNDGDKILSQKEEEFVIKVLNS